MTKTSRSVFVFGIYLFAVALQLILVPNLLLGMFGLPETSEVWIRVVGLLAFVIGYYYVQSARSGLAAFFPFTVHGRVLAFVSFTAFYLAGWVAAPIIIFAVVDLAGAGWTWMAMRSERG